MFDHPHPSTRRLSTWFEASHYSSGPTECVVRGGDSRDDYYDYDGPTSPQSPTVLHPTVPNSSTNFRVMDVPTGRGWGGTTNVHAGLVVEPDYEGLDADAAWPGMWRGGGALRRASDEVGKALVGDDAWRRRDDRDRDDDIGFRPVVTTSSPDDSGRRVNYFAALVGPLLRCRPELNGRVTFFPGARAERVLFDGDGRAQGVECLVPAKASSSGGGGLRRRVRPHRRGDRRVVMRSRGEIVLCAGAIGSPALLLASGLGNEEDLREAGIAPWYERTPEARAASAAVDGRRSFHRTLPVGRNLRDHVLIPRVFVTPRLDQLTPSLNSIRGIMSLDLPIRTSEGASSNERAMIQLQLADGIQMDRMMPHFAAAAIRRRCTSSSALYYPLRSLLRWMICLFSLASVASSLIDWLVSHSWHGSSFERKESWSRGIGTMSDRPLWFSGFVAEFANPYYHWCGTCAMGEDTAEGKDATEQHQSRTSTRDEIASGDHASSFVVDERLCVRGIAGLRICDASIFPACISAPTALTCAALGHVASAFILDADRVIEK
ncbi:hypothetical protein ACHAW5_002858 [Stephanodiscus triporus]|uniref:Glucose-methanol-choline oxidoreductase N-terminal domain-containing protein n=1 Tax=Stephanodiscus triporus TaxID=2934178 RepID=A0ABD3Q083_9STRA